jgi:hypothetical protein
MRVAEHGAKQTFRSARVLAAYMPGKSSHDWESCRAAPQSAMQWRMITRTDAQRAAQRPLLIIWGDRNVRDR